MKKLLLMFSLLLFVLLACGKEKLTTGFEGKNIFWQMTGYSDYEKKKGAVPFADIANFDKGILTLKFEDGDRVYDYEIEDNKLKLIFHNEQVEIYSIKRIKLGFLLTYLGENEDMDSFLELKETL